MNVQLTQRHNDSGSGAKSAVGVMELDVTPDGSRVVAIGNFKRADGLLRDQVVMLDTSGASAVVSPTWATTRYSPYCAKNAFDSWVRDVSFSPDGSFFVIASSGGPFAGTLCDSAARFETIRGRHRPPAHRGSTTRAATRCGASRSPTTSSTSAATCAG